MKDTNTPKEEKKSHLNEVFQKMLDEAYNMGIEHALSVVIDWWNDDAPNVTRLKQRIEALKKPTA